MTNPNFKSKFRWPAEWEKQKAVWFSWPACAETWRAYQKQAEEAYLSFIPNVLKHQDVYLIVPNQDVARYVADKIGSTTYTLHCVEIPFNDSWIRDYGGLCVFPNSFLTDTLQSSTSLESANNADLSSSKTATILNFGYNAWGGKYPPWDSDNQVPIHMAKTLGQPYITIPIILEGGSIDVNGEGLGLTTTSCLLNNNRNPGILKYQLEDTLGDLLGVKHWIWLDSGIEGDDTDGHIDQLARFVSTNRILYARESNSQLPNHTSLEKNRIQLEKASQKYNLELIPIPMPTVYTLGDFAPPACYLNYLVINGAVIVPQFGVPEDKTALQIFTDLFPDRTIYPLHSRELVFGQGGIHCLSQCVFG